LFPHIRKIVIPSQGLFDESFRYFRKNRKLVLISNPLDIENIELLREKPIHDYPQLGLGKFVVTGGRLSASKGFEQLIKVYKQSKLYPSIKLLILGQGELYKKLQELIGNENLNGQVILAGYQINPYRFMSKAKFFILNSGHESFGNVLIESFACDVPVISNDCDFGPRHIIRHGYNGLLYNRKDEDDFIAKLEQIAFNDEIYEKLKEGAIASKKKYNVTEISSQWITKVIE
jgi:glycosyltransferase involved in cell wall biosynthesis